MEQIVGHQDIKKDLKSYLRTMDPPHMMFVGPPGIGKNTTAYAFASEYFGREITVSTEDGDVDYKEINASKDRGIDVVRNNISVFAETASNSYRDDVRLKRIIFLDEVDSTTIQFQLALRSIMEKTEDNCIFILSMNNISGILEPALFSRCAVFRFETPNFSDIAEWFVETSMKEDVYFSSKEIVEDIVRYYRGDFRMMLNDCLESLRGKQKTNGKIMVYKEDVYKIYQGERYSEFIKRIIESDDKLKTFKEIWEKNSMNVRHFLEMLFEAVGFKNPQIFAKVDSRLRRGCNEIIQMAYLFDFIW